MMNLHSNIQYLKGIGSKRAELFKKLRIETVGALLSFFPRDYIDMQNTVSITSAPFDEPVAIRVSVLKEPVALRIRKGMTLYKGEVSDGQSIMTITIFNSPYAAAKLKFGKEFLLYGKVGGSLTHREMNSPIIELANTQTPIKPIYSQTAGLNSTFIANCVRQAMQALPEKNVDTIPLSVRQKYQLADLDYSLKNVHFPESLEAIDIARRRLIFEELLTLQLGLFLMRSKAKKETSSVMKNVYSKQFYATLPFTPTNAQRRAVAEAIADMQTSTPMNRLLQGDVGSGKTMVAATLIDTVVKNGFQAAMLAPTEILAQQHYETLIEFLAPSGITCELLTGSLSAKGKREIKSRIQSGETQVVVGTHAVIQKDVLFKSLALAITDEQHRFGVAQRSAFTEKGENPHALVMSATPIPRTLALIVYGDLDISIIDELPPGRQPIKTYCVDSSYHKRVYRFIHKHLDKGQQGYIVTPLIDGKESELDLTGVIEYRAELASGPFRGYTVAMLHGQMKAQEKEDVMSRFSRGDIQLLVSTTVIEVGVDIPNATVMVIENAERFGLSQLHQLRGRIGRGEHKSTCILITDSKTELTQERMHIMESTTDGFKIADADLKLRGPGDFFGERQHGLPTLRIADMVRDMGTLRAAQATAQSILKGDPLLERDEHEMLAEAVETLFESTQSGMFN